MFWYFWLHFGQSEFNEEEILIIYAQRLFNFFLLIFNNEVKL